MTAAVRARMTMRCTVERDAQTERDSYGGAATPTYQTHIEALPCWFYIGAASSAREERVMERALAASEQPRMFVPTGTDIHERDRVRDIRDRRGADIYRGVMNVLSVVPAHGHLEVALLALEAA